VRHRQGPGGKGGAPQAGGGTRCVFSPSSPRPRVPSTDSSPHAVGSSVTALAGALEPPAPSRPDRPDAQLLARSSRARTRPDRLVRRRRPAHDQSARRRPADQRHRAVVRQAVRPVRARRQRQGASLTLSPTSPLLPSSLALTLSSSCRSCGLVSTRASSPQWAGASSAALSPSCAGPTPSAPPRRWTAPNGAATRSKSGGARRCPSRRRPSTVRRALLGRASRRSPRRTGLTCFALITLAHRARLRRPLVSPRPLALPQPQPRPARVPARQSRLGPVVVVGLEACAPALALAAAHARMAPARGRRRRAVPRRRCQAGARQRAAVRGGAQGQGEGQCAVRLLEGRQGAPSLFLLKLSRRAGLMVPFWRNSCRATTTSACSSTRPTSLLSLPALTTRCVRSSLSFVPRSFTDAARVRAGQSVDLLVRLERVLGGRPGRQRSPGPSRRAPLHQPLARPHELEGQDREGHELCPRARRLRQLRASSSRPFCAPRPEQR